MARLLLANDHEQREVELLAETTIGRSPRNTLQVPDARVSDDHCRIDNVDGHFVLRDLASHDGTYLNGRRVNERVLVPGDQISLGLTTMAFSGDDLCSKCGTENPARKFKFCAGCGLPWPTGSVAVQPTPPRPTRAPLVTIVLKREHDLLTTRTFRSAATLTVGSDPSCDVAVVDPDVAPQHLRLVIDPPEVTVFAIPLAPESRVEMRGAPASGSVIPVEGLRVDNGAVITLGTLRLRIRTEHPRDLLLAQRNEPIVVMTPWTIGNPAPPIDIRPLPPPPPPPPKEPPAPPSLQDLLRARAGEIAAKHKRQRPGLLDLLWALFTHEDHRELQTHLTLPDLRIDLIEAALATAPAAVDEIEQCFSTADKRASLGVPVTLRDLYEMLARVADIRTAMVLREISCGTWIRQTLSRLPDVLATLLDAPPTAIATRFGLTSPTDLALVPLNVLARAASESAVPDPRRGWGKLIASGLLDPDWAEARVLLNSGECDCGYPYTGCSDCSGTGWYQFRSHGRPVSWALCLAVASAAPLVEELERIGSAIPGPAGAVMWRESLYSAAWMRSENAKTSGQPQHDGNLTLGERGVRFELERGSRVLTFCLAP